jgi:DNA-binding IscR family transcriptional regulator
MRHVDDIMFADIVRAIDEAKGTAQRLQQSSENGFPAAEWKRIAKVLTGARNEIIRKDALRKCKRQVSRARAPK